MITLAIEGMTCPHCAMAVKQVLTQVRGVTDVTVNLPEGRALVEGSPSLPALLEALTGEGYSASPLP